jgi:glucosylceramidase
MKLSKKILLGISISTISVALIIASVSLYSIINADQGLGEYVGVVETTGTKSKVLTSSSDLKWADYQFTGNNEMHIDSSLTHEELIGYGAAMTHSSAYLLMTMSPTLKQEALNALFSVNGARLSCIRIPIGTSDFTYTDDFYSLDDTNGEKDYDLESFSISKDEEYLVPALQEALLINPDITFFASPWSAPAWMKTSSSLLGGSLIAGNDTAPSAEEVAYANYLIKFVEAYKNKGINIKYLSLQNEPNIYAVSYPCMQMSADQQARLIRLVGRGLINKGLGNVKISAFDHNGGDPSDDVLLAQFMEEIEYDEELSSYVSGYALHCYSEGWSSNHKTFIQSIKEDYPNKDVYLTEVTESNQGEDGDYFPLNLAWSMVNVTVGPQSAGASTGMYWNAILTEDGKPVKGNGSTCYGVLTLKNGTEIIKNASYYGMAHVSKYAYQIDGVKPIRLDSYVDNEAKINAVSYKQADGTIVVIAINQDATTYEDFTIVLDNKMITYQIPSQSAATFICYSKTRNHTQINTIEFTSIDVVQIDQTHFNFSVSLSELTSDCKFYFSSSLTYQESDLVNSIYTNGKYEFSIVGSPGYYGLFVTSNSKSGVIYLTLPYMSPTARTQEDGTVLISFEFNTSVNWASFCDPYGKSIYRSSKDYFDDEAEQVNVTITNEIDPIYITITNYIDTAPDDNKPYYFIKLTALNGVETIISRPLVSPEHLLGDKRASLLVDNDTPIMHIEADVLSGFTSSLFTLVVKDITGEIFYQENNSIVEDIAMFDFDCSKLTHLGTWYDIEIELTSSGNRFEISSSGIDLANSITSQGKTFKFESWQDILKINYKA